MGKVQESYKKARKYLKLSQRKAAELTGLTQGAIRGAESEKVSNPNWIYTKFLIEQGINPYFLIGQSDEIEGQKIDGVTRAEHETLQQNFDDLEKNYQELENRYNLLERVLQLLQIEVDEQGNVKQKK